MLLKDVHIGWRKNSASIEVMAKRGTPGAAPGAGRGPVRYPRGMLGEAVLERLGARRLTSPDDVGRMHRGFLRVFVALTVNQGLPPQAVYREFLKIDEFRDLIYGPDENTVGKWPKSTDWPSTDTEYAKPRSR